MNDLVNTRHHHQAVVELTVHAGVDVKVQIHRVVKTIVRADEPVPRSHLDAKRVARRGVVQVRALPPDQRAAVDDGVGAAVLFAVDRTSRSQMSRNIG